MSGITGACYSVTTGLIAIKKTEGTVLRPPPLEKPEGPIIGLLPENVFYALLSFSATAFQLITSQKADM